MIYNKVHTTRKTGNNVRYFMLSILCTVLLISCEKLDSASNDERDNLVGVWYCNETGTSGTTGNFNYQVTIAKSASDSTKILVSNLNQLGSDVDVYAKLKGLNLTISSQTAGGFQISGSGTVSSNYKTINWTYTVNTGSEIEHWTAVYSK